jgi:VanZ family protein
MLFAAFAVWGSLFPFDFHAEPWGDAVARFWSPLAVPVSRWSLSDFVSNVLLFVPIGLFATAALARRVVPRAPFRAAVVPLVPVAQPFRAASVIAGRPEGLRYRSLLAIARRREGLRYRSLIVIAGSIALSTAIELAQAFVSWRTPSVVDVGAETLGAACGVVLCVAIHGRLDALVSRGATIVRRSPAGERVLLAYCAIFAVAWLVPADFTLRPNEIADKYAHKRLLLPFTPSPDAVTMEGLTLIAAAAMPIGVTATLCGCAGVGRRSLASAALLAMTFLIALEAAQIFVFSRTTDGTAMIVAIVAASAAAALAGSAGRRRPIAAAG